MTPTTQRIEGHPFGECMRASYATLLDLPIALVPRLDPGALRPGEDQRGRQANWLAMLGLSLVEVPPAALCAVPAPLRAGPHLVGGLSPRGFGHQCVGRGGAVVWDPHPSRAGLLEVWSLGFVVNPGALPEEDAC